MDHHFVVFRAPAMAEIKRFRTERAARAYAVKLNHNPPIGSYAGDYGYSTLDHFLLPPPRATVEGGQ